MKILKNEEKMKYLRTEKGIKRISLLIITMLILVVIGTIGYVFIESNNARFIFDTAIDKSFALIEDFSNDDYETIRLNSSVEARINGETDDGLVEFIKPFIDDSKINMITELDLKNKNELIKLNYLNNDEELADIDIKVDFNKEKIYFNSENFLDKTLYMSLEEVLDEDSEIKDIFTKETFIKKANQKIADKYITSALKKQLKNEYFYREKVVIDGEKLIKSTLDIKTEEFANIIKGACEELVNNEKFLDCYEARDDIEQALNDIINNIDENDDNEEDNDDENRLKIDIYTKGIFSKIKSVELYALDEEDEIMALKINNITDKGCEIKPIIDGEENVIMLIEKANDNSMKTNIKYSIDDVTIELNTSLNVEYNKEIDKFSTKNAIDMNEMSEEDYDKITEKFMDSKLYEKVTENLPFNLFPTEKSSLYDDDYNFDDEDDDEYDFDEEKLVEVLNDGTKLNISKKLTETKRVGNYEFSNFEITEKDEQTSILADVKNVGETKAEVTLIDIILLDKEGNEISVIGGIIGAIEPGETTQLNASATGDFVNVYDLEIKY